MINQTIKCRIIVIMSLLMQLPVQANAQDCVILVHGLARTERSMSNMEVTLKQTGYHVINASYPSRHHRIDTLAMHYIGKAVKQCRQNNMHSIHFVTHSMGGILVRYYLSKQPLLELGRVVMLSPPNQGSEVVDIMASTRLFYWINGPAGLQLSTKPYSVPNQLGPVDYPVGIITGNKSLNPLLSYWIPGDDDGKVSVERARLSGMKAFKVVPHSHTFIMNARKVIAHTVAFLQTEMFDDSRQAMNKY